MFVYSAETLANDPENTKYVCNFNSYNDLVNNWYNIKYHNSSKSVIENRIDKLNNIYDNGRLEVHGHGMEMAFGFGESIHVLMDWYKNITLDAFDFNPLLNKIIPFIKSEHHRINDIRICDAQHTDKSDNYYDFINSCSFFEHLPDDIYWNVLRECYRMIKPNKYLYVYVDGGRNYGEHIRCIPLSQTRKEIESVGFESVSNFIYVKR